MSAYGSGGKPRWLKPEGQSGKSDGGDESSRIRCRRCGEGITNEQFRTERSGVSRHSQVNPHGFIWEFDCFRVADGCKPIFSSGKYGEYSPFSKIDYQRTR